MIRDHDRADRAVRSPTALIAGVLVVLLVAASGITVVWARSRLASTERTVDDRLAALETVADARVEALALLGQAVASILGPDEPLPADIEETRAGWRTLRQAPASDRSDAERRVVAVNTLEGLVSRAGALLEARPDLASSPDVVAAHGAVVATDGAMLAAVDAYNRAAARFDDFSTGFPGRLVADDRAPTARVVLPGAEAA